MSELLLIRHAETSMAGTFCGHSDPSLNDRGRAQVRDLIDSVASQSIAAVYSSDLRRATETATPVSQALGVPYTTHAELREIYFGSWEGMTWAQIEQHDPASAREWADSYPALATPGGETFVDFKRRVLLEADRLAALANGSRVAVVTHAGVMRVVLVDRLGCDEEQAWELTKPYCSSFLYTGTRTAEVSR